MRLTCYGGAGTVTGSLHLLSSEHTTIILDCGMFQGGHQARSKNERQFAFEPADIAAVIVSHAHIDHSGRLPLLVSRGFRGNIFTTPATADLLQIMLEDSAHIQSTDAKQESKRRQREGKKPVKPLYTIEDVRRVYDLIEPVDYNESFTAGDIECVLRDAGHILGSAFVRVQWREHGRERTLLYSGDLGRTGTPILSDPDDPGGADIAILESTYGDHRHPPATDEEQLLGELIDHIDEQGGNLVVPAFAVGRTQELVYLLDKLYGDDKVPRLRVVCDSPMGIKATEVFRHHRECFDDRARRSVDDGDDPLQFPALDYAETVDQSRDLNNARRTIIIAGSGMADGGRVKHHLKHNLWRSESAVLFAGYQAKGTLGRRIVSARSHVTISGDKIAIRARVEQMSGLSAHADADDLVDFADRIDPRAECIVLVHGEDEARKALSGRLKGKVILAREGKQLDL